MLDEEDWADTISRKTKKAKAASPRMRRYKMSDALKENSACNFSEVPAPTLLSCIRLCLRAPCMHLDRLDHLAQANPSVRTKMHAASCRMHLDRMVGGGRFVNLARAAHPFGARCMQHLECILIDSLVGVTSSAWPGQLRPFGARCMS